MWKHIWIMAGVVGLSAWLAVGGGLVEAKKEKTTDPDPDPPVEAAPPFILPIDTANNGIPDISSDFKVSIFLEDPVTTGTFTTDVTETWLPHPGQRVALFFQKRLEGGPSVPTDPALSMISRTSDPVSDPNPFVPTFFGSGAIDRAATTSRFPEVCTNFESNISEALVDREPDFVFDPAEKDRDPVTTGTQSGYILDPKDCGGMAVITLGGEIFILPPDVDSDGIPNYYEDWFCPEAGDRGVIGDDPECLFPAVDEDSGPQPASDLKDQFSNFDEYRGWMVSVHDNTFPQSQVFGLDIVANCPAGEGEGVYPKTGPCRTDNRRHIRGDPFFKDILVNPQRAQPCFNTVDTSILPDDLNVLVAEQATLGASIHLIGYDREANVGPPTDQMEDRFKSLTVDFTFDQLFPPPAAGTLRNLPLFEWFVDDTRTSVLIDPSPPTNPLLQIPGNLVQDAPTADRRVNRYAVHPVIVDGTPVFAKALRVIECLVNPGDAATLPDLTPVTDNNGNPVTVPDGPAGVASQSVLTNAGDAILYTKRTRTYVTGNTDPNVNEYRTWFYSSSGSLKKAKAVDLTRAEIEEKALGFYWGMEFGHPLSLTQEGVHNVLGAGGFLDVGFEIANGTWWIPSVYLEGQQIDFELVE